MPGNYRLEEGMDVYDKNGEKVGEVGQVVVGKESREPRFFTIEKGLLFKTDYLVPREAVTDVEDDGVRLGVTGAQVKSMPEWDGDAPTDEEARQAYENLGARREGEGRYRFENLPFTGAESPQVEGSQGTMETHGRGREEGDERRVRGEGGTTPDAFVVVVEECVVLTPEEREREGYGSEWTHGGVGANR